MKYLKVIENAIVHNDDFDFDNEKCKFMQVEKDDQAPGGMSGGLVASRTFPTGKGYPIGTILKGNVSVFETTDYTFGDSGRTFNKITVVSIGDETPVNVANDMLARYKACVIVNGKATVDIKKLVKEPKLAEQED